MNISGSFKPQKALEVLLYIVKQCPDMYTALKVLYLADKLHLGRYARSISTDRYVAMSHGPVPSGTYDLVKYVRNGWQDIIDLPLADAFEIDGYVIKPLREPDTSVLSESEIECLDEAISKFGKMSFGQLKDLSHKDPAYKSADENDFISVEEFVKSVEGGEELWDYLTND